MKGEGETLGSGDLEGQNLKQAPSKTQARTVKETGIDLLLGGLLLEITSDVSEGGGRVPKSGLLKLPQNFGLKKKQYTHIMQRSRSLLSRCRSIPSRHSTGISLILFLTFIPCPSSSLIGDVTAQQQQRTRNITQLLNGSP